MYKTVVLIVATKGYQPLEYSDTRAALEAAGIQVVVASNALGMAHASDDKSTVRVKLQLAEIDPAEYDGVFLIGGPGALENLDDQATYDVMKKVAAAGKLFGAICISPRILAEAGLLDGKDATGWDDDKKLESVFKKHGVNYIRKPVVVDGKIITAEGPKAARAFGEAIAAALNK